MLHLTLRNLFQSRIRLVTSVGGTALALLLVLALDAIMGGVERQITAYIDHSGADVFVSQAGVRNLHMASSALPASVVGQVRGAAGVATVTPIEYASNTVTAGQRQQLAYVFGLPEGAGMGTPWRMVQGVRIPSSGEAVLDQGAADQLRVRLGDRVAILGHPFTVAGISTGGTTLVNSIAYISATDFGRLVGSGDTVSFVLVRVRPGVSPDGVAARIEAAVPGVTAQSRAVFAAQERRVVADMTTDVVTIMDLVGFLIGLAVVAVTVYTATLARRAEYGVLKAIGARNRDLYGSVLVQALLSVALGLVVGLVLTLGLSAGVPRLAANLTLAVAPGSLLKVAGMATVIAALAAVIPVRQVAGLDPAAVFRRKVG